MSGHQCTRKLPQEKADAASLIGLTFHGRYRRSHTAASCPRLRFQAVSSVGTGDPHARRQGACGLPLVFSECVLSLWAVADSVACTFRDHARRACGRSQEDNEGRLRLPQHGERTAQPGTSPGRRAWHHVLPPYSVPRHTGGEADGRRGADALALRARWTRRLRACVPGSSGLSAPRTSRWPVGARHDLDLSRARPSGAGGGGLPGTSQLVRHGAH